MVNTRPVLAKIFCIGFQKTGTTSLGKALESMGYRVCGVCHELLPGLQAGDFEGIKEMVDQYDAFEDNPWPVLYKKLDQRYPASKFILTLREERKWIRSVSNHFGHTPSSMLEYIYGYPFPEGHEEIYLKIYRQHNQEVMAYFRERPGDLLILDLEKGDSWEKLSAFLGKTTPPIPFPHANKGAYTSWGRMKKYIWKRLRARWRDIVG
jgi:hypothetical protein